MAQLLTSMSTTPEQQTYSSEIKSSAEALVGTLSDLVECNALAAGKVRFSTVITLVLSSIYVLITHHSSLITLITLVLSSLYVLTTHHSSLITLITLVLSSLYVLITHHSSLVTHYSHHTRALTTLRPHHSSL
eukprot:2606401-Prymnesium_polylepis.1